jgi:hypothetical protein
VFGCDHTLHGRAQADCLEPAQHSGEVLECLALACVLGHPGPAGNVRDREFASNVFTIRQPALQHAVQTVYLVGVAPDAVRQALGCECAEVVCLAGHRTESTHLPEEPLHHVESTMRCGGEKATGLLGEIHQHRTRFEHR